MFRFHQGLLFYEYRRGFRCHFDGHIVPRFEPHTGGSPGPNGESLEIQLIVEGVAGIGGPLDSGAKDILSRFGFRAEGDVFRPQRRFRFSSLFWIPAVPLQDRSSRQPQIMR